MMSCTPSTYNKRIKKSIMAKPNIPQTSNYYSKALNINDKSQVPDSHINHPHLIVNQAP